MRAATVTVSIQNGFIVIIPWEWAQYDAARRVAWLRESERKSALLLSLGVPIIMQVYDPFDSADLHEIYNCYSNELPNDFCVRFLCSDFASL